ncbi:MAG: succinate--CoA ligase subunit alpha [Nanoarchaeota archaeon]|nr:succinate--CoA ligase subunit alpha [Nanoarchaeota archaeon]
MAILIDKESRVIIQGITGKQGSFHAKEMLKYGTKIIAGVTPGKGNQKIEGIPIYDNVKEALKKHDADWSIIFVPAKFAKNAALEALENNLNIVIITEGMPIHDTLKILNLAKKKNLKVIGPNTAGIISPGECKIGIMPNCIFKKGPIGVISRSGTLTYEIIETIKDLGQSTVIGIGGDQAIGLNFIEALKLFENDPATKKIILIGEIGGELEEKAAEFIKNDFKKEVIAYIAGVSAPKGKKMGHAGAIISGNAGTAISKIKALEEAGVKIAKFPSDIPKLF